MAAAAVLAGGAAVLLGLGGSFSLDTPSGPSIVVAASVLFAISASLAALLGWRRGRGMD